MTDEAPKPTTSHLAAAREWMDRYGYEPPADDVNALAALLARVEQAEREAVVAWLLRMDEGLASLMYTPGSIADAVERGEHRR